jgi:hypothetical protein
MEGKLRLHPNPKIPLPDPELYESISEGDAPLAWENGNGIEKEAVPFIALTENFSSIPLIAPPPLGNEIEGIVMEFDFVFPLSVRRNPASDENPLELVFSVFRVME